MQYDRRKGTGMMYILDRFEGMTAVVESDDGFLEIPRPDLPNDASEGDVLRKTAEGWQVDGEETARRRAVLLARRRSMTGGGVG